MSPVHSFTVLPALPEPLFDVLDRPWFDDED